MATKDALLKLEYSKQAEQEAIEPIRNQEQYLSKLHVKSTPPLALPLIQITINH